MAKVAKMKVNEPATAATPTTPQLPETGFLRLSQIVGEPKASPPIPPLIPISKTSWWNGVKSGKYPKPIKLGVRTTAWKVEDIRALIAQFGGVA